MMNDTVPSKPRMPREARKPFGSTTQKLAYAVRVGYHRHWFNDIPGRINDALNAGYTHVNDKEGSQVKRVVGVSEGGGSLTAYLMEIPEDWYQEDMAKQQGQVDQSDDAIRGGAVAGKPGEDGRYIPANTPIRIRTTRGSS